MEKPSMVLAKSKDLIEAKAAFCKYAYRKEVEPNVFQYCVVGSVLAVGVKDQSRVFVPSGGGRFDLKDGDGGLRSHRVVKFLFEAASPRSPQEINNSDGHEGALALLTEAIALAKKAGK